MSKDPALTIGIEEEYYLVDRKTRIVKWWHIGPWIRQHDPDWSVDGTITLFDNNRDGTDRGELLGSSRIIAVDPRYTDSAAAFSDQWIPITPGTDAAVMLAHLVLPSACKTSMKMSTPVLG